MFTIHQKDSACAICGLISTGEIHQPDGIARTSRAVRALVKQWGGKAPEKFETAWNAVLNAADESTREEAAIKVRGILATMFQMSVEEAGMTLEKIIPEEVATVATIQPGQDDSGNDGVKIEDGNDNSNGTGGESGRASSKLDQQSRIRESLRDDSPSIRPYSADEIAQLAGLQENS